MIEMFRINQYNVTEVLETETWHIRFDILRNHDHPQQKHKFKFAWDLKIIYKPK